MTLKIGKTAFFSKTISEADINNFIGICGDFNPVHVNDVYARNTKFGARIAHGMLVGSFISTVLGMYMPGPGTIYLAQDLKFAKPVYIGDTVTAIVRVEKVLNEKKGIYELSTRVENQDGDTVIGGTATVKYVDANRSMLANSD